MSTKPGQLHGPRGSDNAVTVLHPVYDGVLVRDG